MNCNNLFSKARSETLARWIFRAKNEPFDSRFTHQTVDEGPKPSLWMMVYLSSLLDSTSPRWVGR